MESLAKPTWRGWVVVLLLFSLRVCCAQDASVPEAGFVSVDRYTNAFFGFSLPLPSDPGYHIGLVSEWGQWHHLFGLGQDKGHTALVIAAQQMFWRDADGLVKRYPQYRILIDGREFSKMSSRQKEADGTAWRVTYLTASGSYVLKFDIQSLDPGIAKNLEHYVEEIKFFDPAKAKQVAGPNARPYNPAPSPRPKK
jgi:hypothetical protein